MKVSRRTEILMDPDEYRRLRDMAQRKKTSMSELIRLAVRKIYLRPRRTEKEAALEAILKMRLPAIGWRRARKEIEAGHLESLPELERQYVEGYRRNPEDPAVGKVGAKLAAEVWPNENWDDVWKSWLPQQPTRRRKKPRR